MYMSQIAGEAADQHIFFFLLIIYIAFVRMLVHLGLAIQHLHLMGQRLAVQLQRCHRAQNHRHGQTQKNHHPLPVLLLFL